MTERSEERPATEAVSSPRRWLERIKVNQFRSVEPGTELCFSEGLHVVLGKNASGKSTLLDLIAASLAVDFEQSSFADEPLDLEFTLRVGALHLDMAIKRSLREANASGTAEDVEGLKRSLREQGRYVLRAPSGLKITVVLSSDDLPQRTVEGVDPARYGLDEPLKWRHQLPPLAPELGGLSNLWLEGSKTWESVVHLLGGDSFLGRWRDKSFRMAEGDELLDELEGDDSFAILLGKSMNSHPYLLPEKLFKAFQLKASQLDGSALEMPLDLEPLLASFIREMGFTEGRMSLGPPRVERHSGQEVFAYSSPTFIFYRDGHFVRRVDQLSYGQRRLFALGWYLCVCDIAILDEPSNGLHESWIAFLVSQLHGRQVFLTSQNRELLDMLPFKTETELSRGFVLC
ncbi:MAG TPA: AAA family ATPase, partial [Kofleriaceae bacterium]|nr:AAA family ATPase [Kofleriaceae bacterium]